MIKKTLYPFPKTRLVLIGLALIFAALACNLPRTTVGERNNSLPTPEIYADAGEFFPRPTEGPYADFSFLPVLREPGDPVPTPTPDPERSLPPIRSSSETYYVRYGDTLGTIAQKFGVSWERVIVSVWPLVSIHFLMVRFYIMITGNLEKNG